MDIASVKEQTSEHNRLTILKQAILAATATAALPDGVVTYKVTVTHKTETGQETRKEAEIDLNSADVATLLTAEAADLTAAIATIEETFELI